MKVKFGFQRRLQEVEHAIIVTCLLRKWNQSAREMYVVGRKVRSAETSKPFDNDIQLQDLKFDILNSGLQLIQ